MRLKDYPVIEVENLSRTFNTPGKRGRIAAIRNISFRIAPREVLSVVGKSGAGKTTLLRVLSLQMPPDNGTLNFGASSIEDSTSASVVRDVTRWTSTVFQGFSPILRKSESKNRSQLAATSIEQE